MDARQKGSVKMRAVHKTDLKSALSILEFGFDLGKFGNTTKKTGQSFGNHPKGIYLTLDEGFRPQDPTSHPWNHKDRGVLIFCVVSLKNPLEVEPFISGKFYQDWLSEKYGAKGTRLTAMIQKEGHDGIICRKTGEIVAFNPNQINIDQEKTNLSLNAYSIWKSGFKEWLVRELLLPNSQQL